MEYDWSYITTLVNFAAYNPDEMCYAHSKGARYIRAGKFQFRTAQLIGRVQVGSYSYTATAES